MAGPQGWSDPETGDYWHEDHPASPLRRRDGGGIVMTQVDMAPLDRTRLRAGNVHEFPAPFAQSGYAQAHQPGYGAPQDQAQTRPQPQPAARRRDDSALAARLRQVMREQRDQQSYYDDPAWDKPAFAAPAFTGPAFTGPAYDPPAFGEAAPPQGYAPQGYGAQAPEYGAQKPAYRHEPPRAQAAAPVGAAAAPVAAAAGGRDSAAMLDADEFLARASAKAQRAMSLAGAVTSVLLICGLAFWGYRLAVRDVTGLPVIRAVEGPARIAPENPGGELAQHRGLAVNTVAALGQAGELGEEFRLAPAPQGLTDEDVSMAALGAAEARGHDRLAPVEPANPAALSHGAPPEPLPDGAPEPILEALAPGGIPASELIAASVPGVSVSLRPKMRPVAGGNGAFAALAAAEAAARAALPRFRDVEAASLTPGTPLAQLGAFETEALARAEWDRIALGSGPLMEGRGRVIQAAESGGRPFFRLRASGFDDIDAARRFCSAIIGAGANCIPVALR